MLALAGTLDVIWGIAAISGSHFFVAGERYIISDLHAWGWVALILGAVEWIAAGSLFAGGGFARWMGPAFPLWSVSVFALSIVIVYELAKPAPA